MRLASRKNRVLCCLAALCLVGATVVQGWAYSESRGIETLRELGTNTQPYTKVSPTGEVVHYYVPNAFYNPYTGQREARTAPGAGFKPETQGNWYGNMGDTNYPNQDNLDFYAKPSRKAQ